MMSNLTRNRQRYVGHSLIIAALCLIIGWVTCSRLEASDTSWYINFETYKDAVGDLPTDLSLVMGSRPGALDNHDYYDWPKPGPPPGPPYVYSSWYRTGWLPEVAFGGDWREMIQPDQSKTWPGLRLNASSAGSVALTWTNLLSESGPPRDYVITLYDEGTSPNPSDGIPYDLFAPYPRYVTLPLAAGQTRYLHVTARHEDAPYRPFFLEGNCWHMITVPGYPVNPWPEVVFYPTNVNMTLFRYDHGIQGYVSYEAHRPSPFGQIEPGDGYWIWLFEDAYINYPAHATTGPAMLYFPTKGWYLIGSPHFGDVWIESCYVHHGGYRYPWSWAANIWLQDPLIYYSCPRQAYLQCGMYPQADDHYLRQFRGYWIYTFIDDVTLEIPPP